MTSLCAVNLPHVVRTERVGYGSPLYAQSILPTKLPANAGVRSTSSEPIANGFCTVAEERAALR